MYPALAWHRWSVGRPTLRGRGPRGSPRHNCHISITPVLHKCYTSVTQVLHKCNAPLQADAARFLFLRGAGGTHHRHRLVLQTAQRRAPLHRL
eukprot:157730-Prorocentrum_minimum.AAC.1